MITGIGIVAPQAKENPRAKPPQDYACSEITGFELPEGAPTWGCEVLDIDLETELPSVKSYIDRTSAFAMVAGKRALTDAGLLDREKRPANLEIGCAFGTMMGCLDAMGIFWTKVKTSNPKFAQPLIFTHGYANSPSSLLCIEHGLRGPSATFSGERHAGAEALLFAFDQIERGTGEAMLVCASESLTQAVWNHFYSSGQLSTKGPFGNDGIVLGEGAVALVLESEASAGERGATVLAELSDVRTEREEGTPRNVCYWRMGSDPRAGGTEAQLDWLNGDLLSAEMLYFVASAVAVLAGRMGGHSPEQLPAIQSQLFVVESRPQGKTRFQAHIKNS